MSIKWRLLYFDTGHLWAPYHLARQLARSLLLLVQDMNVDCRGGKYWPDDEKSG